MNPAKKLAVALVTLFSVLTFPHAEGETLPLSFQGSFHLRHAPRRTYHLLVSWQDAGWAAEIRTAKASYASCKILPQPSNFNLPGYLVLDLRCQGAQFANLSTEASLILDEHAPQRAVFRVGSWLKGYEQAPVKVRVDHLSPLTRLGKRLKTLARRG